MYGHYQSYSVAPYVSLKSRLGLLPRESNFFTDTSIHNREPRLAFPDQISNFLLALLFADLIAANHITPYTRNKVLAGQILQLIMPPRLCTYLQANEEKPMNITILKHFTFTVMVR